MVSGEVSETGDPSGASFDGPAFRLEHEAPFDNFEPDTVLQYSLDGAQPDIVLIDISQPYRMTCCTSSAAR